MSDKSALKDIENIGIIVGGIFVIINELVKLIQEVKRETTQDNS